MGAAAQRQLLKSYSAEAMAQRYLELYGEVAGKR